MVNRKKPIPVGRKRTESQGNGMTSDVSHIIKDEKKITAKTCPIADQNIESATEKATVRIDATITKKTGDEKETFQTLTRSSGRVAKRVKRDISPPASPPKKSAPPKDGKTGTPEQPGKTRRSWELWTIEDKDTFFEAVCEYGKDFDAITNALIKKQRKRGDPEKHNKKKDQVRHFYYRTWHKIFKYIQFDDDVKKSTQEVYGLVNYGELRKRIGSRMDEKNGQKLNELIHKGSTVVKIKGKNNRIKTPICRALKKIHNLEDKKEDEQAKLPERVVIELQPHTNQAWSRVQDMAQNPRLRVNLKMERKLGGVIEYLQKKWKPHRLKLKDKLKCEEEEVNEELKLLPPADSVINPITLKTAGSQPRFDLTLESYKENILNQNANSSPQGKKGQKSEVGETLKKAQEGQSSSAKGQSSSEQGQGQSAEDTNNKGSKTQTQRQLPEDATIEAASLKPLNSDLQVLPGEMTGALKPDGVGEEISGAPPQESAPPPPPEKGVVLNEDSNSKDSLAEKGTPATGVSKEEQDIRNGWTQKQAETLSIAEIYLMLGSPEKIVLEYDWVETQKAETPAGVLAKNLANMLQRLLHLATTEFTDFKTKPTPSSPCRCGAMKNTGTPPNNKHTSKSPSGANRPNKSPATNRNLGTSPCTPKSARALHRQNNSGTPTGNKSTNQAGGDGVFRMPTIVPTRLIAQNKSMSDTSESGKFLQQYNDSKNRNKMRSRMRKPMVITPRALLPKMPVAQQRSMVALALQQNARNAATGSILSIPANRLASMHGGAFQTIAPRGPAVASALLAGGKPISAAAVGKGGIRRIAPATERRVYPLPKVTRSRSRQGQKASPLSLAMSGGSATSGASGSTNIIQAAFSSAMRNTVPSPIKVSNSSTVSSTEVMLTNQGAQGGCGNPPAPSDTPLSSSTPLHTSSPTNIQGLLDISLPATDVNLPVTDNSDKLIDFAFGNSNDSFSGFLHSSPSKNQRVPNDESLLVTPPPPLQHNQSINKGNVTPPHCPQSPFKINSLNPDAQWLNGEVGDFSFSSLLTDSPMKQAEGAGTITVQAATTSIMPPSLALLSENSRDSVTSRFVASDVENALQNLMSESSVDYASQFAELAEQITASSNDPRAEHIPLDHRTENMFTVLENADTS